MNKYARIDKVVRKSDMYWHLYRNHNMMPGKIAERFGVSINTVCDGIRAVNVRKEYAVTGEEYKRRLRQLAWTYVY